MQNGCNSILKFGLISGKIGCFILRSGRRGRGFESRHLDQTQADPLQLILQRVGFFIIRVPPQAQKNLPRTPCSEGDFQIYSNNLVYFSQEAIDATSCSALAYAYLSHAAVTDFTKIFKLCACRLGDIGAVDYENTFIIFLSAVFCADTLVFEL